MDIFSHMLRYFDGLISWIPLITGLFIFPPLVIIVKFFRGKTNSLSDYLPSKELLHSFGSNFALVVLNAVFWAAIFAGFKTTLDTIWEDTFGLIRLQVFGELPLLMQYLLLLFILDFTNYWSHRLLHRPWMWGIHSLHHSDEHMNFSTLYRVHALELIQMSLVSVVIVGWMDFPTQAFALAIFTRLWYGMYLHSRLTFDHGRFRKVFASPNYHRWHHADDPNVYGKNLADMFPIWDILFKTHFDPGRCDVKLGVSDAPNDIIRAQVFPVVYLARLFRPRKPSAEAIEIEMTY